MGILNALTPEQWILLILAILQAIFGAKFASINATVKRWLDEELRDKKWAELNAQTSGEIEVAKMTSADLASLEEARKADYIADAVIAKLDARKGFPMKKLVSSGSGEPQWFAMTPEIKAAVDSGRLKTVDCAKLTPEEREKGVFTPKLLQVEQPQDSPEDSE